MIFEESNESNEKLNNKDNEKWIDKIKCYVAREEKYNIYVFLVIVENDLELKKYYEPITAAIATDFQISLDKAIEKWNVYLVFECMDKVSVEIKEKIEHDKYSTRKLVWDLLSSEEIDNPEYLKNRLFNLEISVKKSIKNDKKNLSLEDKIKEIDCDLYRVIKANEKDINTEVAIYLGGTI